MVNEFVSQARLIVSNEGDTVFSRNIFRRDDDKLVPSDAGSEGDLSNFSAWDLTANRRTVKHTGQNHIVNVPGSSGYLVATFLARNRSTDDAFAAHGSFLTHPLRSNFTRSMPVFSGDGIVYARPGVVGRKPPQSAIEKTYVLDSLTGSRSPQNSRPAGEPGKSPFINIGLPLKYVAFTTPYSFSPKYGETGWR